MEAAVGNKKKEEKKGQSAPDSHPRGVSPRHEASGAPAGMPLFMQGLGAGERVRVQARLSVSQPWDADEQEADRMAEAMDFAHCESAAHSDRVSHASREPERRPAQLPTHDAFGTVEASAPDRLLQSRGGGRQLDPATRSVMESHFGYDFEGVRVHTDAEAARAARSIDAQAYTVRHDVVFGEGQFAPHTTQGQKLLAHELTHVVQQTRGSGRFAASSQVGERVQRKGPGGSGWDPNATVSDAPPFVDTTTLIIPGTYEVPVSVDDPSLERDKEERGKEKQHIMLHTPVEDREDIKLYLIPITKVQVPKAPKGAPVDTSKGTTSATDQGAIPRGSTVKTLDGKALQVLASTPEHVITAEYSKFAVGAASTSALKLIDGTVVVIDAGVNSRGMDISTKDLSALTMEKLHAFIGDNPIREFLISHTHGDHISLAPEILREFAVDTIRINDVQKRYEGYKKLREEMVKAQEERRKGVEDKHRKELESERGVWEEKQPVAVDEGARQKRWEKYVAEELQKRMAEVPAAKERVLIPSKVGSKGGVLDVADIDLKTGERGATKEFKAEDPLFIREMMEPTGSESVTDRRRKTKKSDVDPNASSYIVTLPSGLQILVLPDLRASNMEKLMERFANEISEVGKTAKITPGKVTFQVWDAGHHLQKGWYQGAIPAKQLLKIIDFLHTFRTQQGTDIIVTSAQADLSQPGAKTLIDPVNLRILESLGFQPYIATTGRDVRLFEFVTAQGERLVGVDAPKIGTGSPKLSIMRAKLALDKLRADKQTQEVALLDETVPEQQENIRKAIQEIDAKINEVNTALEKYVEATHKSLKAPKGKSNTTQTLTPPADAAEPALAERQALDAVLEKYNFDRPVTTDARLTEMALVVLRQEVGQATPEPGTPAARALDLKRSRSLVNELGARIAAGEVTPEIQGKLVTELYNYRNIVDTELNPKDPQQPPVEGVSRKLLTDELTSIDAKIKELQAAESTESLKRSIGTGEIIEERAVTLKTPPAPESAATRLTRSGLDLAGRGLGVVMVIHTIKGQGELMRRLEEGKANEVEVALGTAHNISSAVVGVQMVRGIHVSNGVFVALSILDIGQAIARDYESDEERDTEIAFSVISNGLNLGLMAVGQALMRIPHPVTMIAGFLLTFAGPSILEALGVHEWLERRNAFNPEEVTRVYQTLRKLVNEYSIIVGSITLADRTAAGLEDLSVDDPQALREQSRVTARDHRLKAIPLERQILAEFKTAYADALGNYAGLKELDEYREQFIALQHQANPEGDEVKAWQEVYGPARAQLRALAAAEEKGDHQAFSGMLMLEEFFNPEPRPTRELMKETFAGIESKMTLESMTAEDIKGMVQWQRLDKKLADLTYEVEQAEHSDLNPPEVKKQDREAELMIANARYRLNPQRQGDYRSKGMFEPGSAARSVYEEELAKREQRLIWIRDFYFREVSRALVVSLSYDASEKMSAEPILSMVEESLRVYEGQINFVHSLGPPEPIVAAMFRNSVDAGSVYKTQWLDDTPYAYVLKDLEVMEQVLNNMTNQAALMLKQEDQQGTAGAGESPDAARLRRLLTKKKELKKQRYDIFGLIFPSEVQNLVNQVKAAEINELAPLLGEKPGESILSGEELAALRSKDMKSQAAGIVPPVRNRLWAVPELARKDSNGNLTNIYRLVGSLTFWEGGFVKTASYRSVTAEQNVIVGDIGPGEDYSPSMDTAGKPRRRVIPLNQAAINAFGKFDYQDVFPSDLELITKEELVK